MLPLQQRLHSGLPCLHKQALLPLKSLRSSRPSRSQAVAISAVQSIGADAKKIEKTAYKGSESIGISLDVDTLEKDIKRKAEVIVGKTDVGSLTPQEAYRAVAWSVRDALLDAFFKTQEHWQNQDPKFVYYLSAEFLMGRSLTNAVYNLGVDGPYGEAVKQLGYSLEELVDAEQNAALGNGGLGRLAACFVDSMATLDYPGWGYGIRYKYGMFKQGLKEGFQVELPDIWLENGNPWELKRQGIKYPVGFYGEVKDGKWAPSEKVFAQAYDNPIPGFETKTVGNLRLFEAVPETELNLDDFNKGDFAKAVEEKRKAEDISAVLYPNDATEYGKELRLKQQFFFVSASIQDVMARFEAKHSDWTTLPEKAVFQLNDTHPTIAVPELMRLLIDEKGLDWDAAWGVTKQCLAYTNHTVLPEALEKWPVSVLSKLLPRHMEIIERINEEWLAIAKPFAEKDAEETAKTKKEAERAAAAKTNGAAKKEDAKDAKKAKKEEPKPKDPVEAELEKYSIICTNPWAPDVPLVNMAFLATVGGRAVNGVAAIHSEIIKEDIFQDFVKIFPEKFQNKTNGVTPRRWLAFCNPELSALITETLGSDEWIKNLDLLQGLKPYAEDAEFRKKWASVKYHNKQAFAAKLKEWTGVEVPIASLYDIHIKRIHEYKRQYMNMIATIYRYKTIKNATPEERKKIVPRVVVVGGKAASAYYAAKKIVKLVNAVGKVVNNDPDVGDLLKVVFLPDYNVSVAEVVIPAAELSQHISTAGTEASGTSNMKFQANGCLIIGTMDGANIEIADEVGKENMFIFGFDAKDLNRLRKERHDFKDYDPRWVEAFDMIREGVFGDVEYFQDLVDSVNDMDKGNDWFLVANDFASYMDAQDEVDALYGNYDEWTRRSILYTATSGFFSSDRTIHQYAQDIWDIKPVPLP
jgi:starch phosphorylase